MNDYFLYTVFLQFISFVENSKLTNCFTNIYFHSERQLSTSKSSRMKMKLDDGEPDPYTARNNNTD